jgi:tetratricopeptide (TPR) repeat protein
MGLEVLLTPLAAAIAILGLVVVLDAQTVFIESVDVPLKLWSDGFSSQIMQESLGNAMVEIEREGRARDATRPLALEAGDDSIDLVTEYFGLTPLVGALQQSGGFVAYAVDGFVTQDGNDYVLQLQIDARNGARYDATVTHPKDDIPGFVREGAKAIMRVVEPEPLCAAYLAKALTGDGNVDRAMECVQEALPTAERDDQIWLVNLAGVISFVQGDQAAAMERFRQALRVDPTFSPSLVNVGVLFQLNGKPQEAVKAYELLFANLDDGVSDRTYAAGYVEWAKSLDALGRRGEAMNVLHEAIAANPQYAGSYAVLATLTPPGQERDALIERGNYYARTQDQLYTENLVGKVYDAGKARLQPI